MKKLIFLIVAFILMGSSPASAFDGSIYFSYAIDSTERAMPDGGVLNYSAKKDFKRRLYAAFPPGSGDDPHEVGRAIVDAIKMKG